MTALGPNEVAAGVVSFYAPTSHDELEFDYLSQLLWNAYAAEPPAAEAAVFQAMAAIPGVTSQQGIKDIAGRPAIGLSANGDKTQLLLDPKTYRVTGMRVVSAGEAPDPKFKSWPAKGGVVESMAWADVAEVSGPGKS